MATFTSIDNEDQWKRKFKNSDAKYAGPGWYNKDTGLKEEPKKTKQSPSKKSAAIISGVSSLKPDNGFREILKNIKKKNPGCKINDFGGPSY